MPRSIVWPSNAKIARFPFATLTAHLPAPGIVPAENVHQGATPVDAVASGVAVGCGVGVGVGATHVGGVPDQPFGHGVGVGDGVGVAAVTLTEALPFAVPQKNVMVAVPAPTKNMVLPVAVDTLEFVLDAELGVQGPWSA